MYLHYLDIRYCRYSFLGRCIYAGLIFAVADALLAAVVSATCFSLNLQILLSLPIMYNCICILSFLVFEDTSFTNFASTSHIFDNVRMLLLKITHPCSFYALQILPILILHLQSPKIHYRRYRRSISFKFTHFTD